MNLARRAWARLPAVIRRNAGLVAVVLIAIPYIVVVTLLHTRAVSPIDEWVYLDYMQKLPAQGMVHEGEAMSDESLELMACTGVSPYGPIGPPCDDEFTQTEMGEFPNQGLTTASPYTPIYFGVAWATGGVIDLLPGIDLVDGWRLSGALWLLASLVILFRLFRQLGVGRFIGFAVAVAYVSSPYSWWTYSYVSTDAPAVLVGATLLSLAIDLAHGRRVGWLLVAVGIVGTLIKLTNVIGVALALLYLGIVAVRGRLRREPGTWRLLWPPMLALALGVAGQLAWLRLGQALAVGDLRPDQGISTSLSIPELLLQTTNFLPGTITSSPIGAYVPNFVFAPLSWLCVVGVIAAVFTLRARHPTSSLVLAVGAASVIAAPLLAITLQVATGSYFQLPPRYGATLLPGFLLLLALGIRHRGAAGAVGLYAGGLLIVGMWLSGYLAGLA
jgi:hypothetical protein